MFPTVYSLQLCGHPAGDLSTKADSSGYGTFPLSLGQGYSDVFRRDRAPSQVELLGHLVGTAYRCANLNANLIANARLRLYARKDRKSGKVKGAYFEAARSLGRIVTREVPQSRIRALKMLGAVGKSALLDGTERGGKEIEEVIDHPLLDTLHNPEDAFTDGGLPAYSHRHSTQMLLETLGRAYWYVQNMGLGKRGDRPQIKWSLRLLRSQLVIERADSAGLRYIDHYDYGTARLDPRDVVRITYPDPSNPHLGFLSPMMAAAEKIRLMRGGDAFMSALLQNGGYPLGVLSPKDGEGTINDKEAHRIQSAMRDQGGMSNVGRLLVLGTSAVELQTLAWKPAEIIDVARAQELAGEIADCFDVPRTKIFRDSSNRASADSGDAAHTKDAGLPRCSLMEESLNAQLIPLFDDTGTLFLAFDSPVPADRTMQLDETRTGGQLALTTIDEGRGALGLDPIEGELGTMRIIPKGSVLLREDGTTIDTGPAMPDDGDEDATGETPTDPESVPAAKPKKPKKGGKRAGARRREEVKSRLAAAGYSDEEIADKMNPQSKNGQTIDL